MPLVLAIGPFKARAAPHATVSSFFCADLEYDQGAGGGGFPSVTDHGGPLKGLIDRGSVEVVSELRADDESSPSPEVTRVRIILDKMGTPGGRISDLDGAGLVGAPAKLWEVGVINGTTYTFASPWRWAEGVLAPGSWVSRGEVIVDIMAQPLPLALDALTSFPGYGPALWYQDGGTPRATWPAYDPPGDLTVAVRFFMSLEQYEADDRAELIDSGDIRLRLDGGTLSVNIAHATTPANVVAAPLLAPAQPPEAFYWARFTYTASSKTVELFINGVSHGTSAGTGAITQSGLAWSIGCNQAESDSYYRGMLHDVRIYDAVLSADDADTQEMGPLRGDEADLYAWLEGAVGSVTVSIDAGDAVDKGGGFVGIPATGHELVAGQEPVLLGTTNYEGAQILDATTSTNEMVITATFVSETFAGTETASCITTVRDKAQVNISSPKHATAKGVRRGTSLGGGLPNTGDPDVISTDSLGGTLRDLPSGGIIRHLAGYQVGLAVDANSTDVDYLFQHGDPGKGVSSFVAIHEGGVEVTIDQRVLSLLLLYSATVASAQAAAYPRMGLHRLETRADAGLVAADVKGYSQWIKNLDFDGVDDMVQFGTSVNASFNSDYSVRLAFSVPEFGANAVLFGNLGASTHGMVIFLEVQSTGQRRLTATATHAGFSATITHDFPENAVSAEIVFTESFSIDGSNTDFDTALYVDGLISGTASSTVATASIATSAERLVLGATEFAHPVYINFFEGNVSELSVIFGEAITAAQVERWFLEDIRHSIIAGDAEDLGSGLVGIPVRNQPWVEAESVTFAGTTNYNGAQTVHADSTDQQIVITDTYNAETFTGDGTETVSAGNLAHHYPGRWLPAGQDNHPTTTWVDEEGALDGTITGATWRAGGVAPTSVRGVVKTLALQSGQDALRSRPVIAPQPGRRLDFSGTTGWSAYPVAHPTRGQQVSYYQIIQEVLLSLEGTMRVDPDGTVVFGQDTDPADETADFTATHDHDITGYRDEPGPEQPADFGVQWGHVHTTEQPGELLLGVPVELRNQWSDEYQYARAPNRAIETIQPLGAVIAVSRLPAPGPGPIGPHGGTIGPGGGGGPGTGGGNQQPPRQRPAHVQNLVVFEAYWATRAGAAFDAARRRGFLNFQRVDATVGLAAARWMYLRTGETTRLLAGAVIELTHPDATPYGAGGVVKARVQAVTRKLDGSVELELRGIKVT